MQILLESQFDLSTTRGADAVALALALEREGHVVYLTGDFKSGLPMDFCQLLTRSAREARPDVVLDFMPLVGRQTPAWPYAGQSDVPRVGWFWSTHQHEAERAAEYVDWERYAMVLMTDAGSAQRLAGVGPTVATLPVGIDAPLAPETPDVREGPLRVFVPFPDHRTPLSRIANAWALARRQGRGGMMVIGCGDAALAHYARETLGEHPTIIVLDGTTVPRTTDVIVHLPGQPVPDTPVREGVATGAVPIVYDVGEPAAWSHPDVSITLEKQGYGQYDAEVEALAGAFEKVLADPVGTRRQGQVAARTVLGQTSWTPTLRTLGRHLASVL